MYFIYIIECQENKLYTGITTDYKRRFIEHAENVNDGKIRKGAKFTRSFKPIRIVFLCKTETRSNALKLEYKIKQLNKKEKILLIENKKYFREKFKNKLEVKLYRRISIK